MDAKAIRAFIDEHPEGVTVRMIDGTVYHVPGRDWVWLTPEFPGSGARAARTSTAFYLFDDQAGHLKLINAMLVKELEPYAGRQKSKRRARRSAG